MNQYIRIRKNNKNTFEMMVLKMTLPLLLLFITMYLLNEEIVDFIMFVDLYSGVVGGALMILLFLMRIKSHGKFIRYLSWGYLFISIFLFSRLGIDSNLGFNAKNTYYEIIFLVINLFEIMVIKFAIIAYRKNLTLIRTMILFSLSYISIMIIYIISIKVVKVDNYYYLHILFCEIASCFIFLEVLNFKSKYNKSDYVPLLWYVILQGMYNLIIFTNITNVDEDMIFFGYFLRILAFLSIFWLMEKRILRLSYQREVEAITNRKIERIKLNKSLKNQESILKELEMQTRRSVIRNKEIIDKIPELIFIFKNNYLEYMNRYAEEYLSNELNLKDKGISLDNLLNKLIENKKDRKAIYNGSEEYILITDKNGDRLQFKISLVSLNENNKVLIMKSNKDEVESLEIMKKYNYILREEEIMEEFYANISHELRTPINVIYSALQLNTIAINDRNSDIISRNYNIIKQNCKRLIRTINNFIDSNKISDGYLDGNKRVFNIVYLIDEIVEASTKYMIMKNNLIIFDPQEEQVFIYGSVEHTIKIILNILSNALKYGTENSKVFIITYVLRGIFYLEIVYNGDPIPKKKLSYVFRKFTKLDDYLNRTSEGSGLGLFLAKKLVEQSGGTIDIFSDKIGNVATITLPVVNEYLDDNNLDENSLNDIMELVDIEFSDIYF